MAICALCKCPWNDLNLDDASARAPYRGPLLLLCVTCDRKGEIVAWSQATSTSYTYTHDEHVLNNQLSHKKQHFLHVTHFHGMSLYRQVCKTLNVFGYFNLFSMEVHHYHHHHHQNLHLLLLLLQSMHLLLLLLLLPFFCVMLLQLLNYCRYFFKKLNQSIGVETWCCIVTGDSTSLVSTYTHTTSPLSYVSSLLLRAVPELCLRHLPVKQCTVSINRF